MENQANQAQSFGKGKRDSTIYYNIREEDSVKATASFDANYLTQTIYYI